MPSEPTLYVIGAIVIMIVLFLVTRSPSRTVTITDTRYAPRRSSSPSGRRSRNNDDGGASFISFSSDTGSDGGSCGDGGGGGGCD